jgi:hypothetical protein
MPTLIIRPSSGKDNGNAQFPDNATEGLKRKKPPGGGFFIDPCVY